MNTFALVLAITVALSAPKPSEQLPRPVLTDTIIVVRDNALDEANAGVIEVAGQRAAGSFTVGWTRGANTYYVASGAWLKPAHLAELRVIWETELQTNKIEIYERGDNYTGKAKAKLKNLGYTPDSGETP